jgi:UDP-N-acetylmuramoyl-tripeptide--D-alanyl-D-alanine ligase
MGERFGREVVFFGRDRRHEVSAEDWRGSVAGMRFVLRIGGRSVDIALPVAGLHNVSNFLAAAAAAHRLGVDAFAIAHAAARIETASHRGRFLVRNEEVTVLDDSYNASPDAVLAAAQALGLASARRRVAFLGDMLELGDAGEALHRQTGERLAGLVDVVVGVGPLSRHVLEGAKGGGRAADSLHHFPDSEAAAREAASLVRPGDAVLVKGSRAMRMERVLEALLARYEARERP